MEEPLKILISKRFNELVEALISEGEAKNYEDFAKATNINSSSLADIRSLRRFVTIEMLYKVKEKYNLDLNPVFNEKIAPILATIIAPNYKNLNQTVQIAAESEETYGTPKDPYTASRIKELEEEVLKLKAQNEAYLNVIKVIGGERDNEKFNTA